MAGRPLLAKKPFDRRMQGPQVLAFMYRETPQAAEAGDWVLQPGTEGVVRIRREQGEAGSHKRSSKFTDKWHRVFTCNFSHQVFFFVYSNYIYIYIVLYVVFFDYFYI
jgi:hypothetical protein